MSSRSTACAALLLASSACVPDYAPAEKLPRDAGAKDARVRAAEAGEDVGSLDDSETAMVTPRDPARDVCDLTGTWLVTEKSVLNAMGAKQEVTLWRLLELAQDGDEVMVEKSLLCGDTVQGLAPVIITMDSSKTWDALRQNVSMDGRRGTSRADGDGCSVSFERIVEVRGATTLAYRNLDVPLPAPGEPARGSEPGWEDWDGDGNPGLSVRISGTLSGTLYMASRTWHEWSGRVDPRAGTFKLPMIWQQERSPLGYAGSPLLTLEGGAPDPNPALHFAQFAYVSADVLGDSDEARCARVRDLAPTLTPGR